MPLKRCVLQVKLWPVPKSKLTEQRVGVADGMEKKEDLGVSLQVSQAQVHALSVQES